MAPVSRHINLWKTASLAALWAAAGATGAAASWPGALTLAVWTAYTATWLLKSATFPDRRWEAAGGRAERVLIWGFLNLYLVAPLTLLLSPARATALTPPAAAAFLISFTLGNFLHAGADAHKTAVMAAKPGALITGGLFRLCRNPNYLGELLIYACLLGLPSAAAGTPWPLLALAFFYALEWAPNMAAKDASLKRQHGPAFDAWAARAPRMIPTPGSLWRGLVGWWLVGEEEVKGAGVGATATVRAGNKGK